MIPRLHDDHERGGGGAGDEPGAAAAGGGAGGGYVVVDEYLDVHPLQEWLVRALHGLGTSVCVVGDNDQTIYQWRGSEVGNNLGF